MSADSEKARSGVDHRRHGLRDGLDGLRDLMERLLSRDGCPWDREQTLDSLRPYLLEETYEVLEAMDEPALHRQELGDLLFQIVFQSALRDREGHFNLDDVIDAIRDKMIRRHPHVFGDRSPTERSEAADRPDADAVAKSWSRIKAAEHDDQGPENPLRGVPATLPALQRAWRLQEKAAAVGFDWPDVSGVRDKVDEEWSELQEAIARSSQPDMREELGDLLFVLVRLGQKLGVEPEDALRGSITKFERRFAHVMQRCEETRVDVRDASLDTLEQFWREAKDSPP